MDVYGKLVKADEFIDVSTSEVYFRTLRGCVASWPNAARASVYSQRGYKHAAWCTREKPSTAPAAAARCISRLPGRSLPHALPLSNNAHGTRSLR